MADTTFKIVLVDGGGSTKSAGGGESSRDPGRKVPPIRSRGKNDGSGDSQGGGLGDALGPKAGGRLADTASNLAGKLPGKLGGGLSRLLGGLGGGGGGAAGGAGAAAGGAGLAGAAAIAAPVAAVAVAFVALKKGTELLIRSFREQRDELAEYSGAISAAKARGEAARTVHNVERAQKFGNTLGRFTAAEDKIGMAITDLKDAVLLPIFEKTLPLIETIADQVAFLAEHSEAISVAAGSAAENMIPMLKQINEVIEIQRAQKTVSENFAKSRGDYIERFNKMPTLEMELLRKSEELTGGLRGLSEEKLELPNMDGML